MPRLNLEAPNQETVVQNETGTVTSHPEPPVTLSNDGNSDSPVMPQKHEDPRVNILMVDDTPENLIALEAVLSELKQNIVKARSGEEALRCLLKQDFAVILLDVNMPGMNGFETAALIRQRKNSEHIPIIFVSAISTSDTHMFKGYSLGAVDYIFTPVLPDVLKSKVSVFVELLKKTEEAKRQAEQLRLMEEREHQRRLQEAAQRIELQTKQNRFFTLAVDMLAIAGFDGVILEMNPAWHKLLGDTTSNLKSAPFWERIHIEDREAGLKQIRSAMAAQNPIRFETRFRCEDERYHWLAWTIAPYPAEKLLYIFARDITEQRIAEQQINKLNRDLAYRATQLEETNSELKAEVVTRKRAEDALHESNAALEAFSYSVSHDLRAPLRAMQGFGRVLLDDYGPVLDDMGRECAQRIVGAAERMDNLINDLLVYSRLGHTTLDLSPVPLTDIFNDIRGQVAADIEQKQATLHIPPDLPAVEAHRVTLTQVLLNLISNGLKFVPENVPPRIEVGTQHDGEWVVLSLKDNGIGIPVEDHRRVFKVFERLSGAENFPGTGLGLAIVKKGIERMGGTVGLESNPGQGSCFWIKLRKALPA